MKKKKAKAKPKRKARRRIPPTYCEAPPPTQRREEEELVMMAGVLVAALSQAVIGLGEMYGKRAVIITQHDRAGAEGLALLMTRLVQRYRSMS